MKTMQLQLIQPSPVVKKLLIINIGLWVVVNMILEGIVLSQPYVTTYLGFVPSFFVESFMLWQPLTYMFLHAASPFHVLFNMMSLWFFGTELEYKWGWRKFLFYYLMTGFGAVTIYLIGLLAVGLYSGSEPPGYNIPVVGASGCVFGILAAYGWIFFHRQVYFFGIVPLKAGHLVMIMAAFEFLTLLSRGLGGRIANLAHIGGLLTGALILYIWHIQSRGGGRPSSKTRRNLRLVINRDEKPGDGPKYWN